MSSTTGASAALRSGSGTWVSVSLMAQSSWPSGLIAGRHVAPDKFVDLGFDRRALQHHAAISPFDPAVAGCDLRLGQDHQPALEAALGSLPLDLFAGSLVKTVVDANYEVRRRNQVREAIAHQSRDLAERLGGDQFAAQFSRNGDRDIDGLGFHPGLDA